MKRKYAVKLTGDEMVPIIEADGVQISASGIVMFFAAGSVQNSQGQTQGEVIFAAKNWDHLHLVLDDDEHLIQ